MSTITINGQPIEVPEGAVAYKYADPIEEARWLYDAYEARRIASADPILVVWVRPTVTEAEAERLADRRVQAILITDREYRHAENAEVQAAREHAIAEMVWTAICNQYEVL